MNNNGQNIKKNNEKSEYDGLKWAVIIIAGFVIVVSAFGLGVFVGGLKAKFSYQWAENYEKNFAGPPKGFFNDFKRFPFPPPDFMEGHGIIGEIISVKDKSVAIKGKDGVEKVIVLNDDTVIRNKGAAVKKEDLKTGDYIVVIGAPNDEGQIEAKLIRIFNQ